MQLLPRYDGPAVIAIDASPASQLAPAVRQRRRMETLLNALDRDQWAAPTRCTAWDVADVVAHLISVNRFWTLSITEGLAGRPTRHLMQFDPAVTPGQLVAGERGTSPAALLDQFVTSNDGLLHLIGDIDDSDWSKPAECPAGHLPIRLVVQHGLWDAWVHERDIALPLGLPATIEPDEVISTLLYVSAVGPAFGVIRGEAVEGQFTIRVVDPRSEWVLEVTDRVEIRAGVGAPTAPSLEGAAVDLIEALSLRTPLPPETPAAWRRLLAGGLMVAYDADGHGRV